MGGGQASRRNEAGAPERVAPSVQPRLQLVPGGLNVEQDDCEPEEAADDGYRSSRVGSARLSAEDLVEVELFAAIAAFGVVVLGVPVLTAWERANEWLAEASAGELPEGVTTEVQTVP